MDPHNAMYYISGIVCIVGIFIAFIFHLWRRESADELRSKLLSNDTTRWLPTAMEHKWYVDEIYIVLLRSPLWITGKIFSLFDKYIIDIAIVNGLAAMPRVIARLFSPLANGSLQSYAGSMIGGAILVSLLMLFMPEIVDFLQSLSAQNNEVAQLGDIK